MLNLNSITLFFKQNMNKHNVGKIFCESVFGKYMIAGKMLVNLTFLLF